MQQKPITYLRQVVCGTVNPELMADASGENNNGVIPSDASEQGKFIFSTIISTSTKPNEFSQAAAAVPSVLTVTLLEFL